MAFFVTKTLKYEGHKVKFEDIFVQPEELENLPDWLQEALQQSKVVQNRQASTLTVHLPTGKFEAGFGDWILCKEDSLIVVTQQELAQNYELLY